MTEDAMSEDRLDNLESLSCALEDARRLVVELRAARAAQQQANVARDHSEAQRIALDCQLSAAEQRAQQAEQERDKARDELADVRKLAKIESLEDVLIRANEPSHHTTVLRLYEAIATLRVELLMHESEPALVQRVCAAAAENLSRAEAAERQCADLRTQVMRLALECGADDCEVWLALRATPPPGETR